MPVNRNIFIFGDSITYGEWDAKGGWANRVRVILDKQVLPTPDSYTVTYNLGIPSDTSAGIADRLQQEVHARLTPNPAVKTIQMIIAVGANDSRWLIQENCRAVSPAKFATNIEQIINTAKRFTEDINFVGLLPCIESEVTLSVKRHGWVERYDNAALSHYNQIVHRLCRQHQLPFVDVFGLFVENGYQDLFSDGLHPNTAGHELIADAVSKLIQ